MEELLELLNGIRPDIDFENEKFLIDGDILDSFDIIATISEINTQYDIDININDLTPENLNSAEAMLAMIERALSE